jgi:acyl-[acyl-carrier-protein]-phospholipid O-acyltransferase/long-chain-fatty-acid--[acyl-carrier-protein] ligase
LAVFTIGIAAGSLLAARASHGTPNLALVPLGAVLMGAFALLIALVAALIEPAGHVVRPADLLGSGSGLSLLGGLLGLAVAGGLFVVPSFAAVQGWAPEERRARVIAAVNVLNAAYMLAAGAVVAVLQAAGVGIPVLFAALGILTFFVLPYVVRAWGVEVLRGTGRLFQREPVGSK